MDEWQEPNIGNNWKKIRIPAPNRIRVLDSPLWAKPIGLGRWVRQGQCFGAPWTSQKELGPSGEGTGGQQHTQSHRSKCALLGLLGELLCFVWLVQVVAYHPHATALQPAPQRESGRGPSRGHWCHVADAACSSAPPQHRVLLRCTTTQPCKGPTAG